MSLDFLMPWRLLLLIPALGLAGFLAWRSRAGLDRGRLWAGTLLRTLAILCLVAALAQAQYVLRKDELAVAFLLDCSESVPEGIRSAALASVRQACREQAKEKDRAALLAFAAEPALETSFRNRLEGSEVTSVLPRGESDLSAAMRLASAAFPAGTMRRMILLSDGNETRGSALEEAARLKAAGVDVQVLPLDYAHDGEVRVESLVVPPEADRDEAVDARVVVLSQTARRATLSLYQNDELIARQEVDLEPGKNVFTVPRKLSGHPDRPNLAGFYTFKALVEAPGDPVPQNNQGHAFCVVQGESRILLIEHEDGGDRFLQRALTEEGFQVDRVTAGAAPVGLERLQAYDAVILSDVAAEELPRETLDALPSAVRDLGTGLVMIGGERGFGAGGYAYTDLEEVLPVSMDLTQRKVVPNGALVIVLHTCEFQDGNAWAKAIAQACIDTLSPQDWFGELDYGQGTDQWGIPLRKIGDRGALKRAVQNLTPWDMPSFVNILGMAHTGLKPLSTSVKHCIVISDGDPQPPTQAAFQAMRKDGITVSTVGIGPHGGGEMSALDQMAKWGGGRFYNVTDPAKLPKIFSKEAQVVRRALLCTESFLPKLRYETDLLRGVARPLPPLHGYVCTTPKEKAQTPVVSHQGDPILAHWRVGLGKSVAFTSDAKNAWGRDWVSWGEYRRFWSQALRWALRSASRNRYPVHTEIREGQGRVLVDALDAEGRYVNDLSLQGRVSDPARGGKPLEFSQTGPGRYEARFPAPEAGTYFVSFGYQDAAGVQGLVVTGAAVSYSQEYRELKANQPLLLQVAGQGLTRDRPRTDLAGIFAHDLEKPRVPTDLWPWLLQAAAGLFFLDVLVRRVVVGRRELAAAAAWVAARTPGLRGRGAPPPTREQTLSGLLARKAELQARAPSFQPTEEDLAAPPPPEAKAGGPPPAALPPTPTLGQSQAPKSYTQRLLDAKRKALEDEKRKPNP